MAIGKSGVGKSDLLLTDLPTTPTFESLNLIIQKHSFRSDRNHPESSGKGTPKDNVPTATLRTPKLSPFALDGKDDGTFLVSSANVVIANQTKTVVQKTRGHASPSVIGNLRQISFWGVCPFFSTAKSTLQPDEPYFSVVDASSPPPAPWSAPARLTTVPVIGSSVSQNDSNGAMTVDQAGNVHLVYTYVEVVGVSPAVIVKKVLYMKKIGASWTAPTEVYSQATNTDNTFVGYYRISDLKISTDGSNNPHLTWLSSTGGNCSDYNQNEIYYSYFNGSGWSAPLNVSNNATWSYAPRIAIDNSNNIHFVWNDGRSWSGSCSFSGVANLYHKIKYANGSWSNASLIAGMGGYYPALARGPNGYIHLVSDKDSDGNVMMYSYWNGTQWITPTVISSEGATYYRNIAIDGDNHVHIAYDITGDFGHGWEHTVKYSVFNGVSWSNSEAIIEYSNGYEKNPTIAVNTNNQPHIVWYEQTSNGRRILYKQKTQSGWSSAIRLNTDGNSPEDSNVSSAISQSNILHTVWTSMYDGHQEIFYNYADVSTDLAAPAITITAPSTGEILSIGSAYNISWSASDNVNVSNVALNYSIDGGSTFTAIAASLPNSGSYSWTVPNISSDTVQIFIVAADAVGNQAMTNTGLFKISDKTGPSIAITSPIGGEVWDSGTAHNVTWQATDVSGVSLVNIHYSSDGGTTWFTAATAEANDGTYTWIAPNTASTNFRIKIIATDNSSNASSAVSNVFTVKLTNNPPMIPHSPVPFDGKTTSGSDIVLQWQANDKDMDTLSYSIYFGTTNNPPVVATGQVTNSYSPAVVPNTTYYWKVVASDGKATTSSPLWSFTTGDVAVNSPTGLTLAQPESGKVNITWINNASNIVDGFKVERKAGINGTYSEIGTADASAANYLDTSISGHSEYYYRIRAYKGSAFSSYSSEAPILTVNNAPNVPGSPTPSDQTINQPLNITLQWIGSDRDGDATSYDVYFGITSAPPLVSSNQTSNTYTANTMVPNKTYYWKIIAKDSLNAISEGPLWSFTTQMASSPSGSINLSIAVLPSGLISLSWTGNSTNVTGYKIERQDGTSGTYTTIATTSGNTFIDANNPIPGKAAYNYRVRAYNESGYSVYSNENSIQTHQITTSAGINGSVTPSSTVYHGSDLEVFIIPDQNYHIADTRVDGVSVGSVSSHRFTNITADHSISAVYALDTSLLNVTKNGNGTGSVTSIPVGIDCGPTCQSSFNKTSSVALTAQASSGSSFVGWSGDCSGNQMTCNVTMDIAKSVTAIFSDTTPPVTTASPVGGAYGAAQSIGLSANEQATIYYTTNGNTPTESSAVYSTPIPIGVTTTLKFFAKDTAGNKESVKTEVYNITPIVKGDLNGDGTTTMIDAIMAMQVISGLTSAQTIVKDADVNNDGKIGTEEVIYILQRVAGIR